MAKLFTNTNPLYITAPDMVEPDPSDPVQRPYLDKLEPIDNPTTYPVYFEWTAARPDPTSYKQLAPEFHPMGMQIAVDVPIRYFLTYDVESHQGVLTPEGMAYAIRQINLAITKVMQREN